MSLLGLCWVFAGWQQGNGANEAAVADTLCGNHWLLWQGSASADPAALVSVL
jgi:hypothetical protein